MYKKHILLLCVLLILEVKSDCDGYFDCFNSFFNNFFANSDANVEYMNIPLKELPKNFSKVKDVNISELDKVLSDISSFIRQDLTDHLKVQANSAAFTNVNPNTKLYVKTFSYNNFEHILSEIESMSLNNTEKHNDVKPKIIENATKFIPVTTTERNVAKIIENQKDVRENEISQTDDIASYYDSVEDNSTDYPVIDYVELYKDTTNEENLYVPSESSTINIRDEIQESVAEFTDGMDKIVWDINNETDSSGATALPWISTIFLKNDTKSNQFEYFCDGALLNEKFLITAARCVTKGNSPVQPEDLLVILGKRSLLAMADKEQAVKVKQIIIHDNFTNEHAKVDNDIALLELENPVVYNELIQPANIGNDTEEVEKSYTTAWNLQGDIVLVSLESKDATACGDSNVGDNMFCAAYGQDVPLCPSYGGIFSGLQDGSWYLYGIRSGDVTDRGLCFSKNVWFTDLRPYGEWIEEHLE